MDIKEVGIYLRKSRDETDGKEDVLAKHESLLLEHANKKGFKYKIYKEIANSEYIDSRPQMIELLKDVSQDLYDAVLVVDMDRLGRGELEEVGRIKRIFRESNTFVITPTRVYDFNNEEEQIMTDIEMVFANYEYRMIKKRMMRGKKQGAKAGNWTNGTPPFPYIYNRLTKKLEVDPKQEKVYNLMKKMFIEDLKPAHEIAWELNKLGLKTNRNALWYETSVCRILQGEIHLGLIIYGKTSGSWHKNKQNSKGVHLKDRSEWIIAEGSHKPLKTMEEHQKILSLFESRRLVPKGTRRNVQVLSKLIYCGKCKRAMSFTVKPSGVTHVKTCFKRDLYGNRCKNSGINVEVIYAQLMYDLNEYESYLLSDEHKNKQIDNTPLQVAFEQKKNELKQLEKSIERLMDIYLDGSLDKNKWKTKHDTLQSKLKSKKEELRSIEQSLAVNDLTRSNNDRISAIMDFKKAWDAEGISRKELNTLAKEIIERIEFIREGNNVEIKIKFH